VVDVTKTRNAVNRLEVYYYYSAAYAGTAPSDELSAVSYQLSAEQATHVRLWLTAESG